MSIDLDKKAVNELLAVNTADSFLKARKLYREGGHRRSYATLTLTEPLGFAFKKDDHFFFGKTAQGKVVTGNAYEDYVINSTKIGIHYTRIDDQVTYQICTVRALPTGKMNLAGCFAPTGYVKMMSNDPKLVYQVVCLCDLIQSMFVYLYFTYSLHPLHIDHAHVSISICQYTYDPLVSASGLTISFTSRHQNLIDPAVFSLFISQSLQTANKSPRPL